MGKQYKQTIVEYIPDTNTKLPEIKPLVVRMDLHFNEDNLVPVFDKNECVIVTDKPINISLLKKHKEIYVNSVHPGIIGTRLLSNNGFISPILIFFHKIYGKNTNYGAKIVFEVLKHVLKNNINGKYFNERNEEKSSNYSYSKIIQEKLFQISEKLVKDN